MAEPPPTYTREEMDAILKRAIERQQAKAEGIGHEDLVAAAGEVGIPREEVEAAARDLEAEKARQAASAAQARPAPAPDAEARARALRRIQGRAVSYVALTGFFYLLCRQTGGDWWIWPVFGFGISLVMQLIRFFFGGSEERSAERRPSRRERRHMRREQRLADFERKVAIGADALIRVIDEAKRVKARAEEATARPVSPPAAGPRVLVTPPPVRVDAGEPETVEREDAAPRGQSRRTR
jgi:hypothetical protein